jgi:hypothetical protein
MPIIGWACPACTPPGKHVPLDHYLTSDCGLVIHPDYAEAVLRDRAEPHHTEGMVTVTMGLTCPRSRALENSDEDLFVNPLDYNAMLIGQAWDNYITGEKLVLVGKIDGIPMAGEVDRVREHQGHLMIEDWKHSNNNQLKFLKAEIAKGTAVKMEYRIQTSIYAELYSQMGDGARPTKGMVWMHYSGAHSNYNPVLVPLHYDVLPLEEALAYKPYGGDYTVRELYQQAAGLYGDEPVKWSDLPLVGKTMAFGTKEFCDYCQVRAKCFEQALGAPF